MYWIHKKVSNENFEAHIMQDKFITVGNIGTYKVNRKWKEWANTFGRIFNKFFSRKLIRTSSQSYFPFIDENLEKLKNRLDILLTQKQSKHEYNDQCEKIWPFNITPYKQRTINSDKRQCELSVMR